MNSSLTSLVVGCLFFSLAAWAQPAGEVTIRLRDGKVVSGRVLSETQRGYLFATASGTSVIDFADIVDLQKAVTPAAAPVAPPVVAASGELAPPPPPMRPTETAEVSMSATDAPQKRTGVHFGLGASAGANNGGVSGAASLHLEFNFGMPAYRLSLNATPMVMYALPFVETSVDNLFQLTIGDAYAFGVGARVGFAFSSGVTWFFLAPVVQPVIIKLGDRGQHQLSLTGSVSALSTSAYISERVGFLTYAGTVQVLAGYSYFF